MAATLVACGGGGVTTPPTASTPAPTFGYSSVMLSTSAATTAKVSFGGSSATVTFPEVSNAAAANVYLETSPPDGASAPQVRTIAAKSRIPDAIGGSNLTALDYVAVTVDTSVSMTSVPAFSITSSSAISSGASTYIAVLDMKNPSAGWNVLLGPGTVSGSTVSFAGQTVAPPFVLSKGDTYVFALVTTGTVLTPPPPTIASNAAASYSGTKSVSYSYGFDFDYPQPGPTATAAATTLNYTVSANVSVGSSPYPTTAPSAKLVDEHVAETDSGNLAANTFTTDSWVSLASNNGSYNEMLYGQTQQQPTSANLPVVTTFYGAPQVLDELPETNGASWSNVPTSTVAYRYASGDAGTRTVAQNGTYTDQEQIGPTNGGGTVALTENSDGSGSMVGPYGNGEIDSILLSAPSSSQLTITLNFSQFAQQYYGAPPQQTIADSVWYPYASGISFYNEADTVTAGASLPSGCLPNPYGTSATDVKRTITQLDTVVGYIETTTLDSYDVDGFPVCLATNDAQNYAYDMQANTPYIILIGTQPNIETVTTNETLAIQNVPPASSSAASRTHAVMQANALVAAMQAHQLGTFARERAVHMRKVVDAVRGGHH